MHVYIQPFLMFNPWLPKIIAYSISHIICTFWVTFNACNGPHVLSRYHWIEWRHGSWHDGVWENIGLVIIHEDDGRLGSLAIKALIQGMFALSFWGKKDTMIIFIVGATIISMKKEAVVRSSLYTWGMSTTLNSLLWLFKWSRKQRRTGSLRYDKSKVRKKENKEWKKEMRVISTAMQCKVVKTNNDMRKKKREPGTPASWGKVYNKELGAVVVAVALVLKIITGNATNVIIHIARLWIRFNYLTRLVTHIDPKKQMRWWCKVTIAI